jgi:hypothetical protein
MVPQGAQEGIDVLFFVGIFQADGKKQDQCYRLNFSHPFKLSLSQVSPPFLAREDKTVVGGLQDDCHFFGDNRPSNSNAARIAALGAAAAACCKLILCPQFHCLNGSSPLCHVRCLLSLKVSVPLHLHGICHLHFCGWISWHGSHQPYSFLFEDMLKCKLLRDKKGHENNAHQGMGNSVVKPHYQALHLKTMENRSPMVWVSKQSTIPL